MTGEQVGMDQAAPRLRRWTAPRVSEAHVRAACVKGQQIIQTGQALVGKEERKTWRDRPDTRVSTTQFPLRYETGAGTDAPENGV